MVMIPTPLIDDIAEGKCLPFIGAGFSRNAESADGKPMPDFQELAKDLAQAALIFTDLSAPQAALLFERKFGRVQLIESIRKSLRIDDIRVGKTHREFADLPFDTVYTTNFDLLLEEAFAQVNKPCRSLVGELQLPFHGGPLTTNIIKMHGDLRHEEHIIVTQGDYDQFLTRYPVVATHLSAMLITRTPLFIGYSLTDEDFKHIRNVIRTRLGKLERMAYVVQFDVPSSEIEQRLDDNLHIISLETSERVSKNMALAQFFRSIRESLNVKGVRHLRSARPDVFEALTPIEVEATLKSEDAPSLLASTSRLCFATLPHLPDMEQVYSHLIVPVAESVGLSVIRSTQFPVDDTLSVVEQVRSAIQQAQVCIAVFNGHNHITVNFEVGLALSLKKPLVLLARSIDDIPADLRYNMVVLYDIPTSEHTNVTLKNSLTQILGQRRLREAASLLETGRLLAATAIYGIVLENALMQIFRAEQENARFKSERPKGIVNTLMVLSDGGVIAADDVLMLRKCITIRNSAIHGLKEPTANEAHLMADQVTKFVQKYHNRYQLDA